MDLQLRGKTGLVVAGSQGLGRAIAAQWAAEGVEVAVLARSRASLDELENSVRGAGGAGRITGIEADLASAESVDKAIGAAREILGPIDLLLLNTGGPPVSHALGVSPEVWEETYRTLVLGLIRITEKLLPDMRARGFGRILYIGSPGIISPLPYVAMAGSMRSAMATWLKVLAGEVGPDGVTVNTLIPGMIETDRLANLSRARAEMDGITVEEHLAESVRDVPLKRTGRPEEFAAVATFLASPVAAYVTGILMRVDGGWIKAL